MKALSVQNPYAALIQTGEKTVEARTWNTAFRGDLLICSSASPKYPGTISGYALCIVTLEDVTPLSKKDLDAACLDEMPEGTWYAWHLSNLRLVNPFPVKGKLNFYDVSDELIEIIDDGTLTDEESSEIYTTYFAPLTYKYGKIGYYSQDPATGTLIRWRVGQDALEYMSASDRIWKLTEPDSAYENAFYGDSSDVELKDLSHKEAHAILNSWGVKKPFDQ
ncbi:hypothetical protein ABB02_00399 [Clostridiaceae bacterium JG1575]|nr:hypothetical protein ABB02_00399 [Clostridiaceae bacterium JG1575]